MIQMASLFLFWILSKLRYWFEFNLSSLWARRRAGTPSQSFVGALARLLTALIFCCALRGSMSTERSVRCAFESEFVDR